MSPSFPALTAALSVGIKQEEIIVLSDDADESSASLSSSSSSSTESSECDCDDFCRRDKSEQIEWIELDDDDEKPEANDNQSEGVILVQQKPSAAQPDHNPSESNSKSQIVDRNVNFSIKTDHNQLGSSSSVAQNLFTSALTANLIRHLKIPKLKTPENASSTICKSQTTVLNQIYKSQTEQNRLSTRNYFGYSSRIKTPTIYRDLSRGSSLTKVVIIQHRVSPSLGLRLLIKSL